MSDHEQAFYEIATREVAEKNLVAGVYGKAFSQALGDTQVALALYIRLRVEQLNREAGEEKQLALQRQKEARLAGQHVPSVAENIFGGVVAIAAIVWLIWFIATLLPK